MDRRHFIKSATVAGTIAFTPFNLNSLSLVKKKKISDRVMLGNTGIESVQEQTVGQEHRIKLVNWELEALQDYCRKGIVWVSPSGIRQTNMEPIPI